MGVHILEVAAADEHEKGGIAKDDPEFAASLRHCLAAIKATISEVQQEPATILGIFAVQQDTKGSYIYGGDVCLNRLLKEDNNFVNYLRGSEGRNVISMYMPWAGETFFKTRIYRLLELYIEDAEAEIRRLTRENMRIWIESEQRYYRLTNDPENPLEPDDDAMDPCADCPRCKRRKFLGHRYPGHYNPHMTHDHDGHDHDGHNHDGHNHDGHDHDGHNHDGHEHQHNGENGHSRTDS